MMTSRCYTNLDCMHSWSQQVTRFVHSCSDRWCSTHTCIYIYTTEIEMKFYLRVTFHTFLLTCVQGSTFRPRYYYMYIIYYFINNYALLLPWLDFVSCSRLLGYPFYKGTNFRMRHDELLCIILFCQRCVVFSAMNT